MKMSIERVKQIITILVLGGLAGLTIFRLAAEGRIPLKVNTQTLQNPLSIQNRTVVQEENAIIDTIDKTAPSVVAIGVTQRIINPFDPFSTPRNQSNTIGTGWVINKEKGIIVTNRHVVSDTTTKYTVVTKDGKKLDIQRIYRDPNLDLALVQVSTSNIPSSLEVGDSSKIKVGQTAIAIGNALGRFDNTVTTGVVSGVGRAVNAGDPFSGTTERLDDLIQTDAAINPGNSGGPLLNSAGQVIGVNVATTEGAQNIGFAIPINSVKGIVDEFVKNGSVQRAFLGIKYRLITRDLALLNEVPQGAYIQDVVTASPADKANIVPGDIITKIDNQAVNTENIISEVIQSKRPGQTVSLEVWTDGRSRNINVILSDNSAGQ